MPFPRFVITSPLVGPSIIQSAPRRHPLSPCYREDYLAGSAHEIPQLDPNSPAKLECPNEDEVMPGPGNCLVRAITAEILQWLETAYWHPRRSRSAYLRFQDARTLGEKWVERPILLRLSRLTPVSMGVAEWLARGEESN